MGKDCTATHLIGDITPEQIQDARVTVAEQAIDLDDLRDRLEQLGIGRAT